MPYQYHAHFNPGDIVRMTGGDQYSDTFIVPTPDMAEFPYYLNHFESRYGSRAVSYVLLYVNARRPSYAGIVPAHSVELVQAAAPQRPPTLEEYETAKLNLIPQIPSMGEYAFQRRNGVWSLEIKDSKVYETIAKIPSHREFTTRDEVDGRRGDRWLLSAPHKYVTPVNISDFSLQEYRVPPAYVWLLEPPVKLRYFGLVRSEDIDDRVEQFVENSRYWWTNMIKRANYQTLALIKRYETQTDEGRAQAKAAAEELAKKKAAEEAAKMRRREEEEREVERQWRAAQDRMMETMRSWPDESMRFEQTYQTYLSEFSRRSRPSRNPITEWHTDYTPNEE